MNGSVLDVFDRHERREVIYHDMRRTSGPGWVRMDHLTKPSSLVIFASVADEQGNALIAEQLEFAGRAGRVLEWKVFGHDRPADWVERLEGRGFVFGPKETMMLVDLRSPWPALLEAPDRVVRKLSLADDLRPFIQVVSDVAGADCGEFGEHLTAARLADPSSVSVFVGYDGEEAVSAAWSNLTPGSPFVGLYGGSTRMGHRGRGFYRALVRARAKEALNRNRRYLLVEALPTSRPILERLGFRPIGWSREGRWSDPKSSGQHL